MIHYQSIIKESPVHRVYLVESLTAIDQRQTMPPILPDGFKLVALITADAHLPAFVVDRSKGATP